MFIRKRFGGAVGKRRSIFRAVGIAAAAVVFCVGCGNPGGSGGDKDEGGDGRDNGGGGGGGDNSYVYSGGTVKIGNQTWMARNLDRATTNSVCYNNSADSCAKYGRLYNWNDAKTACPSGWHLPTNAEWDALMTAVGGSSTAGRKLKSTSGWYNNGNGTDDYGFSALPGGHGNSDGNFDYAGYYGYWWSATEDSADYA